MLHCNLNVPKTVFEKDFTSEKNCWWLEIASGAKKINERRQLRQKNTQMNGAAICGMKIA